MGTKNGIWKTQTEIGKNFGISSIEVGEILTKNGYKNGKYATEKAINEKIATEYKIETNGFEQLNVKWNEKLVSNIILNDEDSKEKTIKAYEEHLKKTYNYGFNNRIIDLNCPNCNHDDMHQGSVEVFIRDEDATEGCHILIDGEEIIKDTNQENNPSDRRDGIRISFECEYCLDFIFYLAIVQHKGKTHIYWEDVKYKPVKYLGDGIFSRDEEVLVVEEELVNVYARIERKNYEKFKASAKANKRTYSEELTDAMTRVYNNIETHSQ